MWTSSEDDYPTYLERVAEAMTGTPPLPLEEYQLLLEQLDELHLLGIERALSEEELAKLDELSMLLHVDQLLENDPLGEASPEEGLEDPRGGETASAQRAARGSQHRSSPPRDRLRPFPRAPFPRARTRREAWRSDRRRQRGE
ncbi:MAG: hypothetical protein ACE5F1_16005 [Planctomycetota bacterium]